MNELENQAYELCLAIEELPAGEYQTKLSIMASDLSQNIRAAKSQLSMKAIIEKEIKWCEENRGMKGEVYEEAFIAGLKQVLFFMNETEKLESDDLLSEGQVIEEWSNWYDKHFEDIELCNKSDVSQMAFWAGVKAAQQMRAPDKWESPDSTGIVLPLNWDTSQEESTPPTCG